MSVNVYESSGTKTTGNFLTDSIKGNLVSGKLVIYVDTTDGFSKHKIDEHIHDNIKVIRTADLKMICMVLQEVQKQINGNHELVVYIDHFEYTQADIEEPMIQNRSTTRYRGILFNLLNQERVTGYITAIAPVTIPKTSTISASNYGACKITRLENFESPLTSIA